MTGHYSASCLLQKCSNLKITLGGKRIPCYVDTVDFNPTVYYIVPQYDELDPRRYRLFHA